MKTILFGSDLHGHVVDWLNYVMLALGLIALALAPYSWPLLVLVFLSFVSRDRHWIIRTPDGDVVR
jgi:hypothetical protein